MENWPRLTPGGRLARQRRRLGLTLTRMAGQTGISTERLQRLESDKGRLSPKEIAPLLVGYDLTPDAWLAPGAGISPQLQAGLDLLSADELAAVARFVRNLTAGRVNAGP
ncbi:helix-turn-helix domain-containing protein (plasmid) [Microbulbifer sp. ANSA003]|uniref:helix-turn-helix domain-containing protein n=1 Tax=Microbulbifer sp. ANSA003 TaxID=3243360 RepID=UPI0040419FAE